jgi:hypothetical protein
VFVTVAAEDLAGALNALVFDNRALAEEATVKSTANMIWVGTAAGSYLCYEPTAASPALRTNGTARFWRPARALPSFLQHWGLETHTTPVGAYDAAAARDTAGTDTAFQASLAEAFIRADGDLIVDGYIETIDMLTIGIRCAPVLSGGIAGSNLLGGVVASWQRFNLGAAGVVFAPRNSTTGSSPLIKSLHIQEDQRLAEASGDPDDIKVYPPALVGEGGWGIGEGIRMSSVYDGLLLTAPAFSPPNTDNVGGWDLSKIQVGALNNDFTIENGFHHITVGFIDSWIFGMGANLATLRNRTIAATGLKREAMYVGKVDSLQANTLSIFQAGQMIMDKGANNSLTDHVADFLLDGHASSLEHRSGRTQVTRLYATEEPTPVQAHKILMTDGLLNIAQGSIVGYANDLILATGGHLTYSGVIRSAKANADNHLVRVQTGATVVLDNCHFIIVSQPWTVPPLLEEDGGTLIVNENCTAADAAGNPIPLWRMGYFTNPNIASKMGSSPRTRAEMVLALATNAQFKFPLKGSQVYTLDGLDYIGVGGSSIIPNLLGLVPVDPVLPHWGAFTQANVNAMSAAYGYIRLDKVMTVAENVTVNDPIHFESGAAISVNDGFTVTIEAAVESSRQYIFRRTGTTGLVRFQGDGAEGEESRMAHVSWFGSFPLGDDTIDQAVFHRRIAAAMGSSREGDIIFDTGTYYVRSKTTWSRANTVRGTGDRMTNIWAKGAIATTGDVWDTADVGCLFRDFQFNSDSARTSGAYIRLLHERCEAYDIYHDKAHEGVVLGGNECKAYRTKALTQNTAAGSCSVAVQAPRCVVDGVDFSNFAAAFPESVVRVNAQAGNIETLTIQNVTGDGVTIGVLIEVGDTYTAKNIVINGVAVERATSQIKVELTGSGTLDNYSFTGLAASDGVNGLNMEMDGTGDATNGTLTGLTGEGLSSSLLRVFNTSTGILNGFAFSAVSGQGTPDGMYIAGTGSVHENVSGSAVVLLGSTGDGAELKINGGMITGLVTDAATTGVKLLDGCANLQIKGQYTGAGAVLSDLSTSGTCSVVMGADAPTFKLDRSQFESVVFVGTAGGALDRPLAGGDALVTLPGGTAVQITLSGPAFVALVAVGTNTNADGTGIFKARCATTPAITALATANTIAGVAGVVLTGSTGTSGNITVSALDGALHVENREGGQRVVLIQLLGS